MARTSEKRHYIRPSRPPSANEFFPDGGKRRRTTPRRMMEAGLLDASNYPLLLSHSQLFF
jgi:hypothetical protein